MHRRKNSTEHELAFYTRSPRDKRAIIESTVTELACWFWLDQRNTAMSTRATRIKANVKEEPRCPDITLCRLNILFVSRLSNDDSSVKIEDIC